MSKKNNTRKFSPLKKSDQNGNGIPTSNPNDVLDREVAAPGKLLYEEERNVDTNVYKIK